MPHRILVVDDDSSIRTSLAEALAEEGMEVATAENGAQALSLLSRAAPHVVLTDVRMPQLDGHELLKTLRELAPDIDVVLMTAYDDMSTVVSAMRGGAAEFVVKPIDLDHLLSVLRRVFTDRREKRRAGAAVETRPAASGDELIGRDPRMIELFKIVGLTAAARTTVLIRGESGTGKEFVARAIHANSAAAAEPFVRVHCAGASDGSLETELFGQVRATHGGANDVRRGRFAAAGRGTLFLDEIGETPLDLQARLLRVVQEREFSPVGSNRVEHAAARVIAATHQNLEELVATKRFREDLYYRLRVVEIVIPPLCERAGDIPALAIHLLARASQALGLAESVLSDEALANLSAHDWPGNVRELENCIKRAVVLSAGNVIRPAHLGLGTSHTSDVPLSSLDDVERDQVIRILAATAGHRGRAAEILGVSRPRLARLIKKYQLE